MSSILKGLQLNELSNEKLAQYKKAASADATAADKAGDTKKADKRFSGIVKATKKQFANDAKGITEMDSEGYKGTRDDYELGKGKEYQGKPAKAKDVAKDAEKVLDKAFDKAHTKDVKEAYNNYHANRTGFTRPKRDLSGEGEPQGMFMVMIDGRPWKEFTSNVAFARAKTLADKNPTKKIQVRWPTGELNTVKEDELDENCWKGYHKEGNKELFGKTVPNCVKNEDVSEGSESEADIDKKIEFHKQGQAAAQYKGSMNKMHAAKIRELQDKKEALKQGVAEEQHSCPHCGGEMVSEELMNEKKDACYYKVKSRYKVWPSAYASGALVKCRKKGADSWGNGGKKNESSILEGIEQVNENLHKWFKEKWVRFGPDGKIRGDCARGDDSEGKPKCLPQSKAHSLGKKGRASAASRKRREDPNPERSGKAINVNTKKKSNEGVAEGAPEMLKKEMLLHRHAEKLLAQNGVSKDDPDYHRHLGNTIKHLRQFGNIDLINKQGVAEEVLDEKWSQKYKDSINCSNPKGFSQRAHCQGKNK